MAPAPDDDAGLVGEVDARGLLCPLPVLKTQKALALAPAGSTLRVLATDPMAAIDIPHLCAETGHTLIESGKRADGVLVFRIEVG
ncbi:MAG: sulfurtransferase TusA family protein [Alphaproteobacteria bacterium]|nr:sulfurtransferase TusA family protein [Alphaproteobacteria bacterium]